MRQIKRVSEINGANDMGFGFLDANSASQMIVLPEISLVKVAFCMLHTLIQGYDDLDLPLGFLFLS